jgi:hypothetical protein
MNFFTIRVPAPIPAEARTMPAHQSLRPNDQDGVQNRRKPAIQLNEKQTVAVGELDTRTQLPLQHDDLLSERSILSRKLGLGLEGQDKQVQQQVQECEHRDWR